jgi:lipopolysaccharide export system protein LptA
MSPRLPVAAGLWATLLLVSAAASAQGLNFASGDEPVTIDADDGIEWQRDRSAYVARGNATATRGETSVRANELVAYYHPESDGSDIFRIDAVGDVVILGSEQRVVGDRAIYDVARGIVVVTGDDLRLTTPRETLTARDSLEYWSTDQMAVARGDAVVCTGSERLSAEILTAYFRDDGQAPAEGTGEGSADNAEEAGADAAAEAGESGADEGAEAADAPQQAAAGGAADLEQQSQSLDRVEAFGGVVILTSTDRAEGDRGVYYAQDEIAYLTDNVRISQGENQLIGTAAEYDLVTRIFKVENARMYFVQQEEGQQPQGEPPCQVPPFEMPPQP